MAKGHFSKHKVAPEKKRSDSNKTGGQRALNERNRRTAGRQDTHGTSTKAPGSRKTG